MFYEYLVGKIECVWVSDIVCDGILFVVYMKNYI